MPDHDASLPEDFPFLLIARFKAHPRRWNPKGPLVPELKRWRRVYDSVEAVRAAPEPEALRKLGALFVKKEMLDYPKSLVFQVTACHAVIEVLLRSPSGAEDRDLARALLGFCPAAGWVRPYTDLLLETVEEHPDRELLADLATKALDLAEDLGEPLDAIRALRRLRREYGSEIPRTETPHRVYLTIPQAAKRVGLTVAAFKGRMRRGSKGFEHLKDAAVRDDRGRILASAVEKCPRDLQADPDYLAHVAKERSLIQQAKDRLRNLNRRSR